MLIYVSRVCRACALFPDGFDLHLLQRLLCHHPRSLHLLLRCSLLQGVFFCDHAGLVINKFSLLRTPMPRCCQMYGPYSEAALRTGSTVAFRGFQPGLAATACKARLKAPKASPFVRSGEHVRASCFGISLSIGAMRVSYEAR